MEEFLIRMITEPEFVHRAVEVYVNRSIAYINAMFDAGVDAVTLRDRVEGVARDVGRLPADAVDEAVDRALARAAATAFLRAAHEIAAHGTFRYGADLAGRNELRVFLKPP